MRLFRVYSQLDVDEVLDRFDKYAERESHNMLTSVFETYGSSRIGIHSYLHGNRVCGYYETGKRYSRGNHLIRHKNWFFLTVKPTKQGTMVKGCILGDVFFMCNVALLFWMFTEYLRDHLNPYRLLELVLVSFLCGWTLYKEYKVQIKLYDAITHSLQ